MATARRLQNMNNFSFGDRELLYVVHDLADKEGWVDASSVANRLAITHENPTRCVVGRFVWMRKFGVMERNEEDGSKWRLTEQGEKVRRGTLTKAASKAIEGLGAEQLVVATDMLGRRYSPNQNQVAVLMRRAWKHATGLRY